MSGKTKTVKVQCDQCGKGQRNHVVLAEHTETFQDPDGVTKVWESSQIVKCMGCDLVRFRRSSTFSEWMDPITGMCEEYDIEVYPTTLANKYKAKNHASFSEDVSKMYIETIKCLNAGANTLAGGGLRATVEAICRDQKVPGKNLEERINALVQNGVLAKAQADFLHEERYLGNLALHEMKTPSINDLEDGLQIVEGLLATLYILPLHATRLKTKRTVAPKSESSKPKSGKTK